MDTKKLLKIYGVIIAGVMMASNAFAYNPNATTKDNTQTLTNKTISGASNTLSSIPTSSITGVFGIANGGTGGSTASAARASMGLAIGTDVQAYSSVLAGVVAGTYAGNSNINTVGTITNGTWHGNAIGVSYGGSGATDAATARTNFGLAIGTDVQAYDAELTALAGLSSAANKLPYFTGSGTASLADFTAAARALVDDTTTANMLTTLIGGGSTSQVLKWNGSAWAPGADNGTNYTAGTGISIGGAVISVDDSVVVTNNYHAAISATRFTSTQSTGTAPFTVSSTTKVANLNADSVDGLDSTAFLQASNNLSDLASASTARTNLALGSSDSVTHASLTLSGLLKLQKQSLTATGNITKSNVLADASSNAIGATTPAHADGTIIWVKKIDSSSRPVTIIPVSGTIDGQSSFILNTQYQSVELYDDGTNYHIRNY